MIRVKPLPMTAALLLVVGMNAVSAAQGADDQLSIEIVAAQAMLKHQYAEGKIGLNALLGEKNDAPGKTTNGRMRPRARSDAIAKAIAGTVRSESEVRACPSGVRRCRLSGVSALLTLSEPSISGDVATVTATIVQNSPSERQPTDYETVLLTLRRDGGRWAIVSERQLGIS